MINNNHNALLGANIIVGKRETMSSVRQENMSRVQWWHFPEGSDAGDGQEGQASQRRHRSQQVGALFAGNKCLLDWSLHKTETRGEFWSFSRKLISPCERNKAVTTL